MQLLSKTSKRVLRHAYAASMAQTSRSRHTMAIARDIPDSFLNAVVAHSADQGISLALARKQHNVYLSQLRKHLPTFCLPPMETHPDCLFVEDTVVAIGDTAVITQLGHVTRRGEADSIKDVLHQLGMTNVYDMRGDNGNGDERALCDGGDVMYTGRHLFVGMSDRTNDLGFQFLRDAFVSQGMTSDDIIPVPPVVAGKEVLHLKSAVTHIDEHTLLAPEGNVGDSVLNAMKATERGYDAIRLPDILSCNAVVVNGHVLAQDAPCELSKSRIEQACKERNLGLTFIDTSELAKKDGALTCCSVLLGV
ncbi:hypothetical protein ACHAXR_006826 [Thalassiosira sp. AJA248-18]